MEAKTVLSRDISARLHIFIDENIDIKLTRKRVGTLGLGTAPPDRMLLKPEDLLTIAKARRIVEVLTNELNTEKKIPFPSTVLSLDLTPGLNLTIWEDLTVLFIKAENASTPADQYYDMIMNHREFISLAKLSAIVEILTDESRFTNTIDKARSSNTLIW